MSTINTFSETLFHRETSSLIQKSQCREVALDAEWEQIRGLRYTGYARAGALPADSVDRFKDSLDFSGNARTFALYVGGRLASSIRLHIASAPSPTCPAMGAFSDCLLPMLDRGLTVVDPTRFVMDADCARRYRKLPYATVRIAWMACQHVSADILLATAAPEHHAFYRGLFGCRVICSARPYPSLGKPVGLMAVNIREEHERILQRYPFLRSTEGERNALFGPADLSATDGLRFREIEPPSIQVESAPWAVHESHAGQVHALA
jgi:hypothetical protein